MPTFTEKNTVEAHLLDQFREKHWRYLTPNQLKAYRQPTDVFLDRQLSEAIYKLNDGFDAAQIDRIVYELKRICMQAAQTGLVTENQAFTTWLRGGKTMPFGKDGQHVAVRLIDFEQPHKNSYVVSQEVPFRSDSDKRLDLVAYINGIPLVVVECKSPVRPSVSWMDAVSDLHAYEQAMPAFFVPNLLNIATDGKTLRYGSIGCPIDKWARWEAGNLLDPLTVLDLLEHFTLFAEKKQQKIKILCRYPQYEATNKMVEQVLSHQKSPSKRDKQGLIWHFQGSGKSLLMVFTAQKLRQITALQNPTIIIVVDRVDLDTQITQTFLSSYVPNAVTTDDRKMLQDLLRRKTQKIIITTIHKFAESDGLLNDRDNIIVLADEAHRTQEGNLARAMRTALPNAFFFGLTGTPINERDRNTFANFGGPIPYLSRYTFQESIADGATLPLHFETRQTKMHIQKAEVDAAFDELTQDLDTADKAQLSVRAVNMQHYLKTPSRIRANAADIVQHYQTKVAPNGFKAQIVCIDRAACVAYKEALDELLPAPLESAVVMTVNAGETLFKKYDLSKNGEEEQVLDRFKDPKSNLRILIVTHKLLTGFDAPILQTMYFDKMLKDHTLMQAICRVNRTAPNKTHGLIVDYIGVFSHLPKAFQFDEATMQRAITNIEEEKAKLPESIAQCLGYFTDFVRKGTGYEGLIGVHERLNTPELRDAYAKDYQVAARLWEMLSPSPDLNAYESDYIWLSQVYHYVRPTHEGGRLLWHQFGAKTQALIHQFVSQSGESVLFEALELTDAALNELMKNPVKAKSFEAKVFERVRQNQNDPKFEALSRELEALREKAEQKLISSVDFMKGLASSSQRLLQLERGETPIATAAEKKAALSELFEDAKYQGMPNIVEEVITDIDQKIVKYIRIKGWQRNGNADMSVRKTLLEILKKYQLHKDSDLNRRLYQYIKEYY